MNKLNNLLLVAVAGLAGCLGGQTILLVGAHEGDTAKIHGCVNPNSGEIKIVDANATCPNTHWKSLDWNTQGPPGPSSNLMIIPTSSNSPAAIPTASLGETDLVATFTVTPDSTADVLAVYNVDNDVGCFAELRLDSATGPLLNPGRMNLGIDNEPYTTTVNGYASGVGPGVHTVYAIVGWRADLGAETDPACNLYNRSLVLFVKINRTS